jgi:signal transduction histidine kinase
MSRADYLQMGTSQNPALKKYHEDVEVVINQISKISKITGNILKYSKKLPKKFMRIDLQEITEESLQILGPRLNKKNITVKKKFITSDATIFGDATQMEQVFTNLVNNAIDAIDGDGQLVIGIDRNGNNQVIWYLIDNGCGMNDQIREQIFSPFFTTKSANKGTGLGLYIVKNICKNHNAEIICKSEPDKGTTFEIHFKQ